MELLLHVHLLHYLNEELRNEMNVKVGDKKMKKLNVEQIKMARELEKSKGIFEYKNIWLRAWQIMKENHYDVFGSGSEL